MTQVWRYGIWIAETVFIGSALSLLASPTLAQIVPDTSLGAESSRLTPNSNVRGQAADRIDGGAMRGANLFHSFSDFNVNDGQRVYFSNPVGVNNILSRVTGTNLSNISGTLGVDGGANLFLLNPNGIIFGPNARLDISGSFVGSTADRFAFPGGGEFSAANPQAPPLLTVSLPIGLQYGRGNITNRGNLTAGQDLALFGNRLDLQGRLQAGRDLTLQAQEIVQARDSQTAPFVASAGRNLRLEGNQGIDILALSHPQSQILSGGNLSLIGDGTISGDVHFASGGNFSIRSASGGLANFVSLYDPIISATGNVDLAANYSGASLLIESQGNVRVQGTVDVTAPDTVSSFVGSDAVLGTQAGLIVRSGQSSLVYGGTNQNSPPAFRGGVIPNGVTLVGAVTTAGVPVRVNAATGNVNTSSIITQGGNLRLNAVEGNITATDTLSTSPGELNGGNITLNAGRNISTDDLNSSLEARGPGSAGAIAISAGGSISTAYIYAYSYFLPNSDNGEEITNSDNGEGIANPVNGGAIEVRAGRNISTLDIDSGSTLEFSSGDSGDGGAIAISAGGYISTGHVDSSSDAYFSRNSGNGGAIKIQAGRNFSTLYAELLDEEYFGVISSYSLSAENSGNGGAIEIRAGRNISGLSSIDSSSISVFSGDSGDGGAVEIRAGGNFRTGAIDSYSSSLSRDSGTGGSISLFTEGDIVGLFSPTTFNSFSLAENGRAGRGGTVTLATQGVIRNLEIITLSSFSDSGAVQIDSSGDLLITDISILTTQQVVREDFNGDPITLNVGSRGRSGNVRVTALGNLTFNNSSVQSDTKGSDPAGDVTITSGGQTTFNDSRIISNTSSTGRAGDITITSGGQTTFNDDSRIVSNTRSTGRAGSITVEADRLLLNNSRLTADTQSGGGGNIRLRGLNLLEMQNSLISTSAIEAANGGNISINTPDTRGGIIFGSNNSDIIATAVGGAGGQIDIQADSVIGFTEQAEPNRAVLRANATNDISASSASGPQGIINISTRIDPTQGIVELPTDLVDASNLVAQGCAAGGVTTASDLSEFVVTGRGGLSSSPTERLSDNTAVSNWMMLDSEAEAVPSVPAAISTLPRPIDAPIVEAQGWSIGSNGEVVLIANAPTVTPQPPTPAQANCNAARN